MKSPQSEPVSGRSAAPAACRAGGARSGARVFIDFDNTITRGDVLDGIIEKFAVDERWRDLEAAWATGQIGARACLDGQLRCLRVAWPELVRHLAGVSLDPGFAKLRNLLRAEGIDLTVVSDNFDLIIGHLLPLHGFTDVAYLANHLDYANERFVPSFPFSNPACPTCAHCKKIHFLPPNDDARCVVYIGDGRSDRCPSRHADLVFAKDGLLTYLQGEKIPCVAYTDLTEVTQILKRHLHEQKT